MESNGRRSEPRPATPRQRDESGGQGSGPAAGSWLVVAASQAGSSHLRRGEPCADRFEITLAAGALILAVADGAGSAARGAEGAALAARTAARLAAASLIGAPPPREEAARHELVRDVLRQTVAAVQEEIGRLTGACQSPMPDAPRLAAAA
ncbi:MAG TPA: protein phosphatase 2C domain-containing protein, partial [Thermoanaerobaculia bacterium]|nr:protein phosphatase 2C domain-containing protein [Thermoanaerobaculia bacterium]